VLVPVPVTVVAVTVVLQPISSRFAGELQTDASLVVAAFGMPRTEDTIAVAKGVVDHFSVEKQERASISMVRMINVMLSWWRLLLLVVVVVVVGKVKDVVCDAIVVLLHFRCCCQPRSVGEIMSRLKSEDAPFARETLSEMEKKSPLSLAVRLCNAVVLSSALRSSPLLSSSLLCSSLLWSALL
jgi:hypothetical protein